MSLHNPPLQTKGELREMRPFLTNECEKGRKIRNSTGIEKYLRDLKETNPGIISQTFLAIIPGQTEICAGCGDERILTVKGKKFLLRQPGAGILLSLAQMRNWVEAAGITALTSHSYCGAARLKYLEVTGKKAKEVTWDEVNQWNQSYTKERCLELGLEYAGNIDQTVMAGDIGYHEPLSLWYNTATNVTLDLSSYPDILPLGFQVSAAHQDQETALASLILYLSIAMGKETGVGGFVDGENPFTIYIIAPDSNELTRLTELIIYTTRNLHKEFPIVVDGFCIDTMRSKH